MKKLVLSTFTLLVISFVWGQSTDQVVKKMIEAHGGYDAWKEKPTFSFDNIMFSDQLPGTPFWINNVTVDKSSRNVYQEWPIHQSTMAYDGKEAWSENWKIGNPPKFEALFFYYFLNLPWLTQDDNVKLGEAKRVTNKAFANEVFEVDMTFTEKPAVGKTAKDTYKLFIDTETYLLVGYEYTISYGYMLDLFRFPADKEFFGPMFRVNDSFTKVDGLVFPNLMHTMNTEQTQVYGYHSVINYDLNKPFDMSKLEKPAAAVVDTSKETRAIN